MTASAPDDGEWDESHDFIVVGSGAGAVTAALVATEAGLRAVILEKTDVLGGSTAISGGVLWAPNNPVQQRAGVPDSPADAATYLDACTKLGEPTRGASPERQAAFLRTIPEVIAFLERLGMKFHHCEGYSDYHHGELPGGHLRGRSIVSPVFDMRRLGSWRSRLRRNRASKTGAPLTAEELPLVSLNGRTLKSKLKMLEIGLRTMRNRLGADLVGFGGAIQGRLLEIAKRHDVDVRTNWAVTDLVSRDGRVTGVIARTKEGARRLEARRGVLLNTGGFAQDQAMRDQHLRQPSETGWTHANPGETGEMLRAAERAGAALEAMDHVMWVPGSLLPNGVKLLHPSDISKPHAIMVDKGGSRFVNESTSYLTIGYSFYARNAVVPSIPAWLVTDRRHRERYRWGGVFPPGPPPQSWIDDGYMIVADSIEELAAKCDIDAAGLKHTVERFNAFARSGIDEDFGRGGSGYNRFLGDPTVTPNPNLGAIEQAPFYAVRIYPCDVGTCGGVLTDTHGRALHEDGSVVPGLYACGNGSSTAVGRSYPGPGASISTSLAFGYAAARDAAAQDATR